MKEESTSKALPVKLYLDDSSDDETKNPKIYQASEFFAFFKLHESTEKKYSAYSFTAHALGIAVLNNKNSRKLYRDANGYVIGLDDEKQRDKQFKKYLKQAIENTIYRLLLHAFEECKKEISESNFHVVSDAYGISLTYLKDMQNNYNEAISNCYEMANNFYKVLSYHDKKAVLRPFEDLIHTLTHDIAHDLYDNAIEAGDDDQAILFNSWDECIDDKLISKTLIEELQRLKPKRDVLPENHTSQNNDAQNFVSNLLQSNRSDKRRIKNLDDFDLYQTGKQETIRSWFFKSCNAQAIERSIISRGAQNRQNWMTNIEGYDDIYKAMVNIQQNFYQKYRVTITDKIFAKSIRQAMNGQKLFFNQDYSDTILGYDLQQFNEFIATLTQLLFGVEVLRNPSTFIINQMCLDLVINYKYTFYELFVRNKKQTFQEFLGENCLSENFKTMTRSDSDSEHGKEETSDSDELSNPMKQPKEGYRSGGMMPMSHKGVMSVARILEQHYQQEHGRFMPKSYEYKASLQVEKNKKHFISTTDELICLEGKIVEKWLMLNQYDAYTQCKTIEKKLVLLEKTIKDQVKSAWYLGIDIDEVEQFTCKV